MKYIRRSFGVLLAALLVCVTCISAFAMNAEDIDFDHTGSISIEMKNASDEAVTSGQLTLYKVASLEKTDVGDSEYVVTDAFDGCTIDDSVSEAEIANVLADWAVEHKATGTTQSVTSNGTVVFDDLSLGVYLVVQTEDSEGYNTLNPFIVTVPMEEDGIVVYDIDATPKMSSFTAIPEESPIVSEPTVSDEPIVTTKPVITTSTVTTSPVVNNNQTTTSSGTSGAKTGDIITWSIVGIAFIVASVGGVVIATRKKGGADER